MLNEFAEFNFFNMEIVNNENREIQSVLSEDCLKENSSSSIISFLMSDLSKYFKLNIIVNCNLEFSFVQIILFVGYKKNYNFF